MSCTFPVNVRAVLQLEESEGARRRRGLHVNEAAGGSGCFGENKVFNVSSQEAGWEEKMINHHHSLIESYSTLQLLITRCVSATAFCFLCFEQIHLHRAEEHAGKKIFSDKSS